MKYWLECIKEALDDAGIPATPEQMETIASWVEGAHENYSMAHGYDRIESTSKTEADRLRAELTAEREKVSCDKCGGTGREITYGGSLMFDSECGKCHGDGKIHYSLRVRSDA